MNYPLRVPCAYQGGKQRIASQIVDQLLEASRGPKTRFYDLCCGSGAISIELVNRGISPDRITMLDASSWGTFWAAIGSGKFDLDLFDRLLSELPTDKRAVKSHMSSLSTNTSLESEAELYLILQAGSFGGKQIWRDGDRWANAFFRDYWEPTATSVRRSPANPMQPSPEELRRRVLALMQGMQGVNCINADIHTLLDHPLPDNSVVYVDPPYQDTTGYAFGFDVLQFAKKFRQANHASLFVSEGVPLAEDAIMLSFGGAKGGISGTKKGKHQEWITRF